MPFRAHGTSGCASSLYHFLKNRDITQFSPQVYLVSPLKDQMRQMGNDFVRFYCEALMSGDYFIQSPYRRVYVTDPVPTA